MEAPLLIAFHAGATVLLTLAALFWESRGAANTMLKIAMALGAAAGCLTLAADLLKIGML